MLCLPLIWFNATKTNKVVFKHRSKKLGQKTQLNSKGFWGLHRHSNEDKCAERVLGAQNICKFLPAEPPLRLGMHLEQVITVRVMCSPASSRLRPHKLSSIQLHDSGRQTALLWPPPQTSQMTLYILNPNFKKDTNCIFVRDFQLRSMSK